ncbi:MAG TPA: DUF58 domain-containing protein [Streptosporangiaceae bacterium]|nr:DUF58 domain-containing protein [Streptosporangiaceae bacterium]
MAVTGRAALVALAGTLAMLLLRTTAGLLAVDGVILATVVVDLILAAGVRQLTLTRSGDTSILLGQQGTATLTIVNPGRRPLRAIVRDAWQPSLQAGGQARVLIQAGGQVTVNTTLAPTRRGDKAAGLVTIRSLGPLGLAARQRSRAVPWTVRVLPPFLSRKHLPEKLTVLRQLLGQHSSLIRGQGAEFDSLREYVIGDDVRSIDWRSSARRAEVLVRTWRPERDRRVVIVLDTGRTSAGRVAGVPRLDSYLDAALLLTAIAVRAGDRIDLLAVDRQVRARVVGVSRTHVLARMTDAMAVLGPELAESDGGLIASTLLATARQRCLVVLLTDLNSAALELGLLPKIGLLAARHRLLVAAVADPRMAEMAAGRGDAASVYQAAAAERALADRARMAARLSRAGVGVVDAPPDRLPAALADAYLSLKGAGQL